MNSWTDLTGRSLWTISALGNFASTLIGASSVAQLEDNVAALDIRLSDADIARLEEPGGARGDRYADMSAVNR